MKKLNKSLCLIGFQTSGKTTLGSQLAQKLACPFVDTDHLIEKSYSNLSCNEIHRQVGAISFREIESQIIQSLKIIIPSVISIGGGSLLNPANVHHLKAQTTFIYLKTSFSIIHERIKQKTQLPAYLDSLESDQHLTKLYLERVALYEYWTDQTLEMDKLKVDEAVELLIQLI